MAMDAKSDRLWRVLPSLSSRNEWDVQLQDVHTHMEALLRRVSRLEEGGGHASTQLQQLGRKCRTELCTERQLATAASRLDVDLAAHRAEMLQGLADLRSFVVTQVNTLRQDVEQEVEQLRSGLRAASKEFRIVNAAIRDVEARSATVYATKARCDEDVREYKRTQEEAVQALEAKLDDIRRDKAERPELEEMRVTADAAFKELRHELEQSSAVSRARMNTALAEVEDRNTSALEEAADAQRNALSKLDVRLNHADEDRDALHAEFASLRSEFAEAESMRQEHGQQLKGASSRHTELGRELGDLLQKLEARCEKTERELKELDRRERSSWEQFMQDRS